VREGQGLPVFQRNDVKRDQINLLFVRLDKADEGHPINPQFGTPRKILSCYQAINQSAQSIEFDHFVRTRSLGRLCGLGLPTLSTGRGCYPFVVAAGIPEAFKKLEQGLSLPQSGRVGLKDTRIPSKEGYQRIESNQRCLPSYRSDEQTSDKRGSENRNRRNRDHRKRYVKEGDDDRASTFIRSSGG
jgi:hypothetical protein